MSNSLVLFISLIFHSEACAPDATLVSLFCLKSKYWAGITWGEEERVAVAPLWASLPVSLPVSLWTSSQSTLVNITPLHPCEHHPTASLQKPPAPPGHTSCILGMAAVNKCGVFPPDKQGKGLREKCWSANETCVSQGFSAAALQLCCQLRTNSQHGH